MAIGSQSAKSAPEQLINAESSGRSRKAGVRRRFAQKLVAAGCLGFAAISFSGCIATKNICRDFRECIDDQMADYTHRALAEKAWIRQRPKYCGMQYIREFKDGFIHGYLDVATGGDGCTPSLAPSKYWGWRYQSPHGQTAVNAFFQGFPIGAKAADEDGVGFWQQIQTSGSHQFFNPLDPRLYSNGENGVFPIVDEIVPTPVEAELEMEFVPESSETGEIEFSPAESFPEGSLSRLPVIESPSDESEIITTPQSAEGDSIETAATEVDQSIAEGIDDTSVFNLPENATGVEASPSELPFSFE